MRTEAPALHLRAGSDAVPRARQYARELARSAGLPDLAFDVELVVAELVTNAVLHAAPPLVLRVLPLDDGLRVELSDGMRIAPVRGVATADSMTGRGLALIEELARGWGVQPLPDGKLVWCEVGPLQSRKPESQSWWLLEDGRAGWVRIDLGDVPTDLLLATKAHVDNLVRELTLAASGAEAGQTPQVPPHLARMIETVVTRFGEARHAMKRLAMTAALRGESRTRLVMALPPDAAEAGRDYLRALEEADNYARTARLLTLETPPQQQVFRSWYVESLIDQLSAAAAGRTAPRGQTFEERLLAELDAVAAAHRATDRAARLQGVTAALAGARTVEAVAETVVRDGAAATAAAGGILLECGDDGVPHLRAAVGHSPQALAALLTDTARGRSILPKLLGRSHFCAQSEGQLPAPSQARPQGQSPGQSPGQSQGESPGQSPGQSDSGVDLPWSLPGATRGTTVEVRAACAVPVAVYEHMRAVLVLTFDSPRLFDDDERGFLEALAAQAGQALDRSRLFDAERVARRSAEALAARLARLQRVTAELTEVRDEEELGDIVVTHAADATGAVIASLCLLEPDGRTLRIVRIRGASPVTAERWQTFPLDAALPASEAVRTNRVVTVGSRREMEERYPMLSGQAASDRSLVCLPMSIGSRRLGVISLSFPLERDLSDESELGFLTTFADASAQAVDRARVLAAARLAQDKLTFLADASEALAGSVDFRTTAHTVARLVVPRLADWSAVHILEEDDYVPVAVAHRDQSRAAVIRSINERFGVSRSHRSGVAAVMRTGIPELFPVISDEALAEAGLEEEHLAALRSLGIGSGLIVPLSSRGRAFGTLSMFYGESRRHYDEEDLAFAAEFARRAAVAVDNARLFRRQSGRLAAIRRVAEAAQRAILAPVPATLGPLALSAAYVSATSDARVGGDFYEVIRRPGDVRVILGDVRGKGLEAVRLATIVLGAFRSAAVQCRSISGVMRQIDERVRPYLSAEDFVTAVTAEVGDDGRCEIVLAGHPSPLLVSAQMVEELSCPPALPLGLGTTPRSTRVELAPGDRLLFYTDGLIEARNPSGDFVPLATLLRPLPDEDFGRVLPAILARLRAEVGGSLHDDLAMLLTEFRPERTAAQTHHARAATLPAPRG